MIPLEDNFNDVLSKAMRGLAISDSEAAEKCGLTAIKVQELRAGTFDEIAVRQLAPVLQLNPDALVDLGKGTWYPEPREVEGLAQFNTPWEDMMVNSYLVWDPATKQAVAFDSGADCTEMLSLVKAQDLKVQAILLTHTHGDHIFDLDRLRSAAGAPAYVGDREPLDGAESFAAGRAWSIGALQIQSRLTWGHSKGGITYVVTGLSRPLAIVGDAVFAGSMGGGGISYADALLTNRSEILTLSDETVICSGHGPLTTLGEERQHNPFLSNA